MQANINFKLKDQNSDKDTLIYLISYFNKQRFKYSTGLKINPDYWLPEKQTVSLEGLKGNPQQKNKNRAINTELTRIKLNFDRVFQNLSINGVTPDPELIRQKLDELEPRKQEIQKEKTTLLIDFVEQFIKDAKAGKILTRKGRILSQLTVISYTTTKNVLLNYEANKRLKIGFEDINADFYKSFLTYCNKQDFTPNYISKHIKNIKVFCRAAVNLKLTDNRYFQERDFSKFEQTGTKVYLSVSEVNAIYNLNLTSKRLDNARDLFIVALWTGLRISDLKQLRPQHFNLIENEIQITTIKTNETVVIPIHWQLLEVFKKYGNNLPRSISDQKMNEYIKTVCSEAKIKEPVQVTEFKGGLRVDKFRPKHELVTVHTARRSFATNCFLAGIPAISIMKITGHTTESSFLKYLKISSKENAQLVKQNQLFSPLRIAK